MSYVLGSVGGTLFTKLLSYMMVKVGAGRALRQLTRLYVSYTTALMLFIQERTDNITRAHVDALVKDRVFVSMIDLMSLSGIIRSGFMFKPPPP